MQANRRKLDVAAALSDEDDTIKSEEETKKLTQIASMKLVCPSSTNLLHPPSPSSSEISLPSSNSDTPTENTQDPEPAPNHSTGSPGSPSMVSAPVKFERMMFTGPDTLMNTVKDLHRSSVSLPRFQLLLEEECENSFKSIVETFKELRQSLNDREAQLLAQMEEFKKQAVELLEQRQENAAALKLKSLRLSGMSETQVTQLRNEIKNFVTERKIDEELAKTTRFVGEKDEILSMINNFGRVMPIKSCYSPVTLNPPPLPVKKEEENKANKERTDAVKPVIPATTSTTIAAMPIIYLQTEEKLTSSYNALQEVAELHARLQEALRQQGLSSSKSSEGSKRLKSPQDTASTSQGSDSKYTAQHTISHQSSSTNPIRDPPELNKVLPSLADIKAITKDADLPVDVLLLTVTNPEFLACYSELKNPYRCYFDGLGYVYFSDVDESQEEVKVALIKCYESDIGPGGALASVKTAATVLRPKAVISVGSCSGLSPAKSKLGDVVVSAKLTTYASKVVSSNQKQSTGMRSYVSKRFLHVIKNFADGWQAPVKNPEAQQVQVFTTAEFLCVPEQVRAEWRCDQLAATNPQAMAIGNLAAGVFAAAFDCQMEWIIIKGIADYADGSQLPSESWSSYASVMAASLVAHILNEPFVFHSWPHCQGSKRLKSPQDTASTSQGSDSKYTAQHTISHQSSSTNPIRDPPELNKVLPSLADIKAITKDADLPVDVLLLTFTNYEFLACYSELKNPYRCYFDDLGYVYFSDVDESQEEVKVALIKCYESDVGPGGALASVKTAATVLRPKAVISVGSCSGLSPAKSKLGDVVVSAKLATYSYSIRMGSYVSRRFLNVIMNCADGWQAPVKNPAARQVQVYTDTEFLSVPEQVRAEWRCDQLAKTNPRAVAIENEGEGVFAAAFHCQMEWLIVKGIADYADGSQLPSESWSSYASVIAASLVAHILNAPFLFHSWPHYQGSERLKSPQDTATTSQGSDSKHTVQHVTSLQSSSKNPIRDPPELNKVLPSLADIKAITKDADLPVDVLLLTVTNPEFLACYSELKNPYRCYFDGFGFVYFSDVGESQGKVRVALLRCSENSIGPGGALASVKTAATVLRPKAVISVGSCSGLNPAKSKLGDVVVSAKLATYSYSTRMGSYVSRRFLDVIKNCADGWQAPVKNPEAQQVQVYTAAEFLSVPEQVRAEWRCDQLAETNPQAVAIENVGEGAFVAAFGCQIEWLVVKGIADYAHGSQLPSESWSSYASVMAASLVAHILSNPSDFHSWPHYQVFSKQGLASGSKEQLPSPSDVLQLDKLSIVSEPSVKSAYKGESVEGPKDDNSKDPGEVPMASASGMRKIRAATMMFEAKHEECIRVLPYIKDGQIVVQFYVYSGESGIPNELEEEAQQFFKEMNVKLEWSDLYNNSVNVLKVQRLVYSSGKPKTLTASQVDEMNDVIEKNLPELSKHRNITSVQASFKIKNSTQTDEPCITLYVLGKGIFPIGERKFPNALGGYLVDVVNGFWTRAGSSTYSPWPPNSAQEPNKILCSGVSIGVQGKEAAGTLGAIVKNDSTFYALSNDHVMTSEQSNLIVHPSLYDHLNYLRYYLASYKREVQEVTDLETEDSVNDLTTREALVSSFEELKVRKDIYVQSYSSEGELYMELIEMAEEKFQQMKDPPREIAEWKVGVCENFVWSDGKKYYIDAAIAKLFDEEVKNLKGKTARLIGNDGKPRGCSPVDKQTIFINRLCKSGRTTGYTEIENRIVGNEKVETPHFLADSPQCDLSDLPFISNEVKEFGCETCEKKQHMVIDSTQSLLCDECKVNEATFRMKFWRHRVLCISQEEGGFASQGDSGAVIFEIDRRKGDEKFLSGLGLFFAKGQHEYDRLYFASPLKIALDALTDKLPNGGNLELVSKF